MKRILHASLCVALLFSLSACLVSRAQLKADGSDKEGPSQPVPAEVQEVQPQGQYAIDEIKTELTRLAGRIEDLEHRNKEDSSKSGEETIKKLEARIIELENAQAAMLEAIKKTQSSLPAPDAVERFEKGKADYKAGNFEAAIENFNTYLKNPNGKHAEEAIFLRGEAFFSSKQYKKAIIDFSKFPEKYHRSRRMPAALFRIGQSFDALGMKEDAKGFYQELVEKFPKAPEIKKARAKLK